MKPGLCCTHPFAKHFDDVSVERNNAMLWARLLDPDFSLHRSTPKLISACSSVESESMASTPPRRDPHLNEAGAATTRLRFL